MPAYRILIVEDEEKLLDHLASTFRGEGFSVFTASTLKQLESLIELPVKKFDIVLLDRLLQGRDAGSLIPRIKGEVPGAKIMILSAINTSIEKAALLNAGADDYLSKPFASEELIARVNVLIRRRSPEIQLGNMSIDVENRILRIDQREVSLTNREFMLLKTLAQTPGKIFSKTSLYEQVWEMSSDVESNVIETTVNRIRRRLEELGASMQIKNSRNLGYWIEE